MDTTQNTWVYPGCNTIEELTSSGHRPSHFLFMLLYLKNPQQDNGSTEFFTRQVRHYHEYFIRHEKHFEMIIQHFGCPGEMHEYFLRYDSLIESINIINQEVHPGDDDYHDAVDQENDAYFRIQQIIKDYKSDNSVLSQIKFVVQDPQGFSKTITIDDEAALDEVMGSLESLPEGKPLTRKRGRRKLTNQNEFYTRIIRTCFEFINTNYKQELTLTNRLFFTALALSVVYLDFQSPLIYKGSVQDFKEEVSDMLKYYMD